MGRKRVRISGLHFYDRKRSSKASRRILGLSQPEYETRGSLRKRALKRPDLISTHCNE